MNSLRAAKRLILSTIVSLCGTVHSSAASEAVSELSVPWKQLRIFADDRAKNAPTLTRIVEGKFVTELSTLNTQFIKDSFPHGPQFSIEDMRYDRGFLTTGSYLRMTPCYLVKVYEEVPYHRVFCAPHVGFSWGASRLLNSALNHNPEDFRKAGGSGVCIKSSGKWHCDYSQRYEYPNNEKFLKEIFARDDILTLPNIQDIRLMRNKYHDLVPNLCAFMSGSAHKGEVVCNDSYFPFPYYPPALNNHQPIAFMEGDYESELPCVTDHSSLGFSCFISNDFSSNGVLRPSKSNSEWIQSHQPVRFFKSSSFFPICALTSTSARCFPIENSWEQSIEIVNGLQNPKKVRTYFNHLENYGHVAVEDDFGGRWVRFDCPNGCMNQIPQHIRVSPKDQWTLLWGRLP